MTQPRISPAPRRLDGILTVALALLILALYLSTLCPTVFWYDSAEYATAAATLGIPHPPGYPLYTLVGRLFVYLPLEPAYAVNLMSAVFGAAAVALAFAVLRETGAGPWAAAVGASGLGASHLFWSQAIIAEVYTPGLCFVLLVLLLLLRGTRQGRSGAMIAAAGVAGLGLGVHLFLATMGLGYALLVLAFGLPAQRPGDLRFILSRRELRRRLHVAAGGLTAAMLGSCIYLYLPLRASMHPALNFGDPSTWQRFSWVVTGGNYKGWWLRDYDRLARALRIAGIFYDQLLLVGIVLAAAGLLFLFRRRAVLALAYLLMLAGNIAFFFNYRVHDVEVFFLPSVVVLFLLLGLGAQALLDALSRMLPSGHGPSLLRVAQVVCCAYPLSLALANHGALDLRGYTGARDYGEKLSRELPRGAVIANFTTPPEWKNDAVFADYFQKVLHRRPDVRVEIAPSPRTMLGLVQKGVPLYLYYPDPRVTALFEVKQEGVAYRVVRPRGGLR